MRESTRNLVWKIIRRRLGSPALIARLLKLDPAAAEAVSLSIDFAALMHERQPETLSIWLMQARGSAVNALRRFAKRLLQDCDAVRAAMTPEWSNGQTQGQ